MAEAQVISVDGIAGPGRRTNLILGEVNELGFEFKRKVIKVVTRDGNMGHYDMVPITSIEVTSDGKSFTMSIESKEEPMDAAKETKEDKQLKEKEKEDARIKTSDGKSEADRTKEGLKTGSGVSKTDVGDKGFTKP